MLAAVSVTPCAAACGCITNTLGSSVSWNCLNISVRFLADTSPRIMSVVIPSARNLSVSTSITCLNGTNTNIFLLDSFITSRSTLYLCVMSNSNASPVSVYTAPALICSSLFIATAALTAVTSSPHVVTTNLSLSSL